MIQAFTLDIERALQTPGVEVPFELSVPTPADWGEDAALFPQGIRLSGTSLGAGESVFVRGTVYADYAAACARCLKPVLVPLAAPIREVYAREVDPSDPEKLAYSGHTLDIGEQIRAALLLYLPMRTLCQPDCPGLCPVCGADLSQGSCACPAHPNSIV
jgi:uncharacterized protein